MMLEVIGLIVAGLATFVNIVGVAIPQWVKRDYEATDFCGRRQVGLWDMTGHVFQNSFISLQTFSLKIKPLNQYLN